MPAASYDVWLRELAPRQLDGDHLVLTAPDHAAPWVADRFGRVLQTAATAVLGTAVAVDVVPCSSPASAQPGRAAEGDGPTPGFTFEQFVIGGGNRLAHAAALAVAELPGTAYNPLFICGPPGVGKTHLLHAIAGYAESCGDAVVQMVTADGFTSAFVRAAQAGSVDRFKALYRGADMLLIDDVQFLQDKTRTEEELFHTFNALYETGRQLVFTSDRLPRDIDALEERLRERFEAGLVADIAPPDFGTRLTILRKWAHDQQGWDVGYDVLEAVASQSTGNVRALQGLLIRVIADSSCRQVPITPDLVMEVGRRGGGAARADAVPTLTQVQQLVCETFDLTVDDLVSQGRTTQVVWPRHVAMYLARQHTGRTLPAIGAAFGGRDHTTVLHACRRVEARLRADAVVHTQLADLANRLRSPGRDRAD